MGEVLTRRVLEPGDLVQVVVIEEIEERAKGTVHDLVVQKPPRLGIYRTRDGDVDLEAVAVKPRALVSLGDVGKPMGGLETKFSDEPDVHAAILAAARSSTSPARPHGRGAARSAARARAALPRCERAFFSAGDSSALVHRASGSQRRGS
jgi:hypothetical protein